MNYKIKAKFFVNGESFEINTVTQSLKKMSIQDAIVIRIYNDNLELYGQGIYEKVEAVLWEKFQIRLDPASIARITKESFREEQKAREPAMCRPGRPEGVLTT